MEETAGIEYLDRGEKDQGLGKRIRAWEKMKGTGILTTVGQGKQIEDTEDD
jgi:hypothetical protein